MARYFSFEEIASREPTPEKDIQWLAGQISRLPAFANANAVLHGSVAWGKPSWRSDIDVALFKRRGEDPVPAMEALIEAYDAETKRRFIAPRLDVMLVGAETERIVSRANLVAGSAPITERQTISEYFEATRLRLADHIEALASMKGEPWRTFHSTFLRDVDQGREARRTGIRTYVSSFAGTWQQQPLRASRGRAGALDASQLEALGHAENFGVHLMRQVVAERGAYPSPDRAPDVESAFKTLRGARLRRMRETLAAYGGMQKTYQQIVADSRSAPKRSAEADYYRQLRDLVEGLPFGEIEEVVWAYLAD